MAWAGLGVPIAGGATPARFVTAIHAVTLPPTVYLGVRFPKMTIGGSLCLLSELFHVWREGARIPWAPGPKCPALLGLRRAEQILPLVPTLNLPADDDFWMVVEHFPLILRRLTVGDIDVGALPAMRLWTRVPHKPHPYQRPRVRGDVTPAQVKAFAAHFPKFARYLMAAIAWSGTRRRRFADGNATNALVSAMLGIRVDVRVGCLAPRGVIDAAHKMAGGDLGGKHDTDSLLGQIDRQMAEKLRRVRAPRISAPVEDLRGSAWSCAVDAILNPVWPPKVR
jgi:hypothetical protein